MPFENKHTVKLILSWKWKKLGTLRLSWKNGGAYIKKMWSQHLSLCLMTKICSENRFNDIIELLEPVWHLWEPRWGHQDLSERLSKASDWLPEASEGLSEASEPFWGFWELARHLWDCVWGHQDPSEASQIMSETSQRPQRNSLRPLRGFLRPLRAFLRSQKGLGKDGDTGYRIWDKRYEIQKICVVL